MMDGSVSSVSDVTRFTRAVPFFTSAFNAFFAFLRQPSSRGRSLRDNGYMPYEHVGMFEHDENLRELSLINAR